MTALLVALVGCYSPAQYEDDYNVAICDKSYECYDDAAIEYLAYDSFEQCVAERDWPETDDDDCVFDPDQAKLCVDETEGMNCVEFLGGLYPAPCDLVCGAPDA
jgi:hypothetical protein